MQVIELMPIRAIDNSIQEGKYPDITEQAQAIHVAQRAEHIAKLPFLFTNIQPMQTKGSNQNKLQLKQH